MLKSLSQIVAVAWLRALPGSRKWISYLLVFTFPMMFLFLYTLIGGAHMRGHVLLGALVAFLMNNAIVSLPQTVIEYKYRKLQDIFVASPVHPFIYLLGLGVSRLIYAAPGLLLILVILLATGDMPAGAMPVTFVVLLISWATSCAIGFTLATYINNIMQVSAVSNLLGLAIMLLPPVLYPLELIPADWRIAALLFPSASAAQLIRGASGASTLDTFSNTLLCWAVLVGYSVLGTLAVVYKSRWRER